VWCEDSSRGTRGRPPYQYGATFERALEETRRLVGDAWHLERYFEEMGFAERAL
jgi:hypothetical protein